MSRQNDATSKN